MNQITVLYLLVLLGANQVSSKFLDQQPRMLQWGPPSGPNASGDQWGPPIKGSGTTAPSSIDINILKNLLDDFMKGNQQAEDLIKKIDEQAFDQLQQFLYKDILFNWIRQNFIETSSMPLLAQEESDKEEMRLISNQFVRKIFESNISYRSKLDPNDKQNLVAIIKIIKEQKIDINFGLTLAEDQVHIEEKFVLDKQTIFSLGNAEALLILRTANPTADQEQIDLEIKALESAIQASKEFFLGLAEDDEDAKTTIEEAYAALDEFKSLKGIVFKYLKDPKFKADLDVIINQVREGLNDKDLVTVFEEIQKNEDLAKQILKGDVSQMDEVNKQIINNSKKVQEIVEKQTSAAAQVASADVSKNPTKFEFPGDSTNNNNTTDDGSNVFLYISLTIIFVVGGFFLYRFIRRKYASGVNTSTDGGSFQQMD